jgi:hypothetical protein
MRLSSIVSSSRQGWPPEGLAVDCRLSTVDVVLCGPLEFALFVIIVAAQDD